MASQGAGIWSGFAADRGQVKPVRFTRFEAVGSEMVEIVVGDVVVRVGGDVDPDRLVKIIRAVRKA